VISGSQGAGRINLQIFASSIESLKSFVFPDDERNPDWNANPNP